MEWKDIWKDDPPRNEEIFFMTGDETIHIGQIFSEDKLRKCKFHSFSNKNDYECDSQTDFEDRVIYWFPIPEQPERSKREDLIEMIVAPEPDEITKIRLEQDIQFFKSRGGINLDLLGYGALNTMET